MRVAILEDDPDQVDLVSLWLTDAGYHVTAFHEGGALLRAVRRDSFDLYLLDWLLPDISGIDVLSRLRTDFKDFTPAIVATVKDEEASTVAALETGADDYLVKPIRRAELLARAAAVLRRTAGAARADAALDMPPYLLDPVSGTVSNAGREIVLTAREFALALFFFRNVGKILSRSHILEEIWGIDNNEVSTRTVDTHVSRLRKKMQLNQSGRWRLTSVYQHGYRIERLQSSGSGESQRVTGEDEQ